LTTAVDLTFSTSPARKEIAVIDRSRFLRLCVGAALTAALWPVHAQQVFRITAIPDESPTELARKLFAHRSPELFGVDEHTVEVEDDGVDHAGM